MNPERRRIHRERPEGLSYIQFEPVGGGLVLNASEQGLAFQAAASARHPGPIRLCISPNPMQRIELIAEIVWMNETKKFGGLRFTELTTDARNQIRQWLTQTSESETPDRKFAVPSRALRDKIDPCPEARNGTREPLPPTPALHNVMPARADSTTVAVPRYRSVQTTGLLPGSFSQEKKISGSRPQLQRRLATGFLVLVFVFMPILFLQNFRREIGGSLIRIGEKLKGNDASQTNATSSEPVRFPTPSLESPPSVPNPVPETPINEALEEPGSAASIQTIQGTENSMDPRPVDRQNPRQHFADMNSRKSRSVLVRQLWSAVEAGDSAAEVALAQLYLTGDGVPKNCEQARVLLRAASKSGNVEALEQLRKLNRSACRQSRDRPGNIGE